jgi:predicted GTPase
MDAIGVILMGAAGRDFHNFNLCFRGDPAYRVVAFTAAQIPNIDGRRYPPELAGPLYPGGIPIHPEADLERLIAAHGVREVVFAYSDASYAHVMHQSARALARGADFRIIGPDRTMVRARVPVVSVCAVRTGCGKSQTARRVVEVLRALGRRVVVLRHPMPYGDLARQRVQRFALPADLDREECTIEEREEYEPHLAQGAVVFAGVDYEPIVRQAEREADVIVWDGGNNDLPMVRPDLEIVLVDPHRPGHETAYHPGEANLRRAHVVLINKVDTAPAEGLTRVRRAVREIRPEATVVEAASVITVDRPEVVRGRRVLVVEDGPTLTHGEMAYGAGALAARQLGAAEIVDPRRWAVGSIARVFERFPHIGAVLPAMGYGREQVRELEETIARADVDGVVVATPIDLLRVVRIARPVARVRYDLVERTRPDLAEILARFVGAAA